KKGKSELYLKDAGALETHLLETVCRDTTLSRGTGAPITGEELAKLIKKIENTRQLRKQLDKRGDERILSAFAEAGLSEDDLKDRDKLERLEAKVMAEVTRRHDELGQAAAEYKLDAEHGTWQLRYAAGVQGVRRHTLVNSDLVRMGEFIELRKHTAE